MPLETAVILCTALHLNGHKFKWAYSPTHINHPVTKWTTNWNNFVWLCHHGIALCKEYTERYGRIHACQSIIENCFEFCEVRMEYTNWRQHTPFAMAMETIYRQTNPILAYREYMQNEKGYYATWKIPSRRPKWWKLQCKEDLKVAVLR